MLAEVEILAIKVYRESLYKDLYVKIFNNHRHKPTIPKISKYRPTFSRETAFRPPSYDTIKTSPAPFIVHERGFMIKM